MADEKDAKLGELLKAVAGLGREDLNSIRAFLRVLAANQGNAYTPIENAIIVMAQDYEYWVVDKADGTGRHEYGLGDLQREVDEAANWLKSAIESAKHFNRLYPHLLREAQGGENAAGAA